MSTRPIVVKIGGALLEAPEALDAFWEGVASLRRQAPVVVVHGGGPQAIHLKQAAFRLYAQKAILEYVWHLPPFDP